MDKKFPYTTIFESQVCLGGSFKEAPFYSHANLEGLRGLIPTSEVNIDRNFDLLAFAANVCGVGIVNKNDDVISPETAVAVYDLYRQKALNKLHNRVKIVGDIVSSPLRQLQTSEIISPEDAIASQRPFNISVGGVVYRVVDKEFSNAVEESADPNSSRFGSLSLSMEKGFANFGLMIGSKNFFDAEIVNNQSHVNELKKYLRAYGGEGKTKDGEYIYRLIGSECLPMGAALTFRPAGVMQTGLIAKDSPKQVSAKKIFGGFFNFSDNSQKSCVTPINPKNNMEKLEQILEEIKASLLGKKVTEEAIAGIHQTLSEKMVEANKEWLTKQNEALAAKEKAEKELSDLKATQEAQAAELAATKEKLANLEAKAAAEAAENLFSARMAEMDAEFELDADDKQVLASDIKTLDDKPETFAAFKDKMGKLMKDKKKGAKEAKASEIETLVSKKLAEIAKASANSKLTEAELAQKALDEAKASEGVKLPNNNGEQNQKINFREKFANFKASVEVK